MDYRMKIFTCRKTYATKETENVFINAIRHNVSYHNKHCPEYAGILEHDDFKIDQLTEISDLYKLTTIPTLYFKHHELFSLPEKRIFYKSNFIGN